MNKENDKKRKLYGNFAWIVNYQPKIKEQHIHMGNQEVEDEPMGEEAEYEEVDEHKPQAKVKPQAEETKPPANSTTPPPQISNVDLFVNRVKDIVTKAAEKNGQQIEAKPNGWSLPYIYNIEARRICDIMDDLRKNHESYITNVINVYQNPVGTTLIGAFIGRILKIEGLACSKLQYSDLNFALKYFYNDVKDPSKRLSDKFNDEVKSEGDLLINTFIGLMKKHQ